MPWLRKKLAARRPPSWASSSARTDSALPVSSPASMNSRNALRKPTSLCGQPRRFLCLAVNGQQKNCLCAIELKVGRFEPEHLGKLNFYLEALDRDVRKPHENPAIGVLLCASKDAEVVEYALSRSLSSALVAEYQTQLPDKKLLQAKLHEFYLLTETENE